MSYLHSLPRIARRIFPFSLALTACLGGCDRGRPAFSPPGYDLEHPQVIRLPFELDEISGLSYWAPDTSLFAINDEQGYLYKIPIHHLPDIKRWKFATGNDYEDIALMDSTFFVLRSNGNVLAFRFVDGADSLILKEVPFGEGGSEFEALLAYPKEKKLLLVCKDCNGDRKSALSTVWLHTDSLHFEASSLEIPTADIASALGKKKLRFKPSAAAVHPLTGQMYLVSAVNKVLVVADDGIPRQVYRLDKGLFKQPEGMAFSPEGHLFISNEAAGTGVAQILIFPYQPRRRR